MTILYRFWFTRENRLIYIYDLRKDCAYFYQRREDMEDRYIRNFVFDGKKTHLSRKIDVNDNYLAV